MKIFVTGGTGYIGKYLLKKFEGHEVLCLSRSPVLNLNDKKIRWITGDLQDLSMINLELEKFEPDVAVHMAWQGLPDYSRETCDQNVQMSLRLLAVLLKTSVKRVLVAGSGFEYGSAQGELFESMKVDADSNFAEAKLTVFDEFSRACSGANIELVWSRIFFSFGPGQRTSSLLPVVYRALINREIPIIKMPGAIQDFVFIDDVASALLKLGTANSVTGLFNIGSGSPSSVSQMVNLIAENCHSDFRMENIKSLRASWASIEKIKRYTGWEPRYTLDQGVAETIKELEKKSF